MTATKPEVVMMSLAFQIHVSLKW